MTEPNEHQYEIKFRCPNCGTIFSKILKKGDAAQGRGGYCPKCGVRDGTPHVGSFGIIKENPEYDNVHSGYNAPRM